MIIHYTSCQWTIAKCAYIKQNTSFKQISLMLKKHFYTKIASVCDFWLDNKFWCGPLKLMRAVTGNNQYTNVGLTYGLIE